MKRREAYFQFCIFNFQLFALLGCVTDTLYHSPHPDRGAVRVMIGEESRVERASVCTVHVGEAVEEVASGGAMEALFSPGEYDLLAHDSPAGITVSGTVASVNRLADGTLEPCPGELLVDRARVSIPADDTLHATVTLAPLTRRLTVRFTVTGGGDLAAIASVDASLTGIAPSVDMASGTLQGDPARVKPVFVKAVTPVADGSQTQLTAEMNLTGVVAGSRQVLVITITDTDGQQQARETDITALLSTFNEGSTPLCLDADLELMTGADFGFSITGWENGEGGTGEAV